MSKCAMSSKLAAADGHSRAERAPVAEHTDNRLKSRQRSNRAAKLFLFGRVRQKPTDSIPNCSKSLTRSTCTHRYSLPNTSGERFETNHKPSSFVMSCSFHQCPFVELGGVIIGNPLNVAANPIKVAYPGMLHDCPEHCTISL